MNFLAHLFLSCDEEDLLIGNFIADFIGNKEMANYPQSIQDGVRLHRLIDSFTDAHPYVRKAVKRMRPFHHKYAPVVIDIIYDHLLANNWNSYSRLSLDDFANKVYKILNDRISELPLIVQKRLPGMIKGKWLQAYGYKEGMLYTLRLMDERASFPSNFVGALAHLEMDYERYNEEFNQFFPELFSFVKEFCDCR